MFVRPGSRQVIVIPSRRRAWLWVLMVLPAEAALAWLMWSAPAGVAHPLSTEQWIGRGILAFFFLCLLLSVLAVAMYRSRWTRRLVRTRR